MIAGVIPYPNIDPILVELGPFAVRWYALAYIAGLVIGWWYARKLAAQKPFVLAPEKIDDFLLWAAIGVVLGGRLGYVLFYKPGFFLENPAQIIQLWHGGMSFHGGLLGVIAAMALFARRHNLSFPAFADICAAATPPGLFFGRIANFINGELWGRVSDAPWAMVFPNGGPLPRHPSQIYQALLEGALLFALLTAMIYVWRARYRPGLVAGMFCAGYAIARIIGEIFREPDAFLGFIAGPITMGMLLSLPALAVGVFMIVRARRNPPIG